jgi:predicted AAA+ superfamily ATPase
VDADKLPGIEPILKETGLKPPKRVQRAVFVGTKTPPGQPHQKPDGTVVRTMWGEIAWQLGGREGYEMVRESDERGTSPGERMTDVFRKFGPCLILIDEWVAYARQLFGNPNLPAGTFDTHFTWAQSLSESAKAAPNTLLIISVPSSDNEIGGEGGKAALDRLKNAIGRIESPWRPASTEEGYEIVRRRLFQPFADNDKFVLRDSVVRAFGDLYRTQGQEFPNDAREAEYERRMKSAYPIHPELFDRLFNDWSSLDKFQRTRGVLRLMASVIHALWEREDRGLMIMPASIPIDDPGVQFELTRYLDDQWNAVIEKDVDGPNSLPLQIDRENPNFGRYSACRRVARTLYLGSAPTLRAANKGLEDRQIRLGCVQPGETAATFGDALRRLSDRATYLFVNAQRYWYSTQPTVTRLAQDRAQQYRPEDIHEEIKRRLIQDAQNRGEFSRVHTCPASTGDVPDEMDARLVILPPASTHSARSAETDAIKKADEILKTRGNAPRNYQNTLIFLAADKARVAELEAAVRDYLAWKSIDEEHEVLNLDAFQRNQAATKRKNNNETVDSRLLETYCWALSPHQPDAQKPAVEWSELRLQGAGPLAIRAGKKLVAEAELYRVFSGSNLRMALDKIPLWRGNHVGVRQLQEDFAKYLYLPRLKGPDTLIEAIMEGTATMTIDLDGFYYADSWDEGSGRYRGLKARVAVFPKADAFAVVVKPEAALAQIAEENRATEEAKRKAAGEAMPGAGQPSPAPAGAAGPGQSEIGTRPAAKGRQLTLDIKPTRFHGSVELNASRVSRDAGKIADEVIAHLAGLMKANVRVTIEIEAEIPEGVPDHVVRTVSENCRTLQFKSSGFEVE